MISFTDHFLVSMPGNNHDMFSGSVVYLTEHNPEGGAVGVMINKQLPKKLKNAFKDLDFANYHPKWAEQNLYLGGPMNNENGFVLHRYHEYEGRLFELTNDRSVLDKIASSKENDDIFISIGYASWDIQQLEQEIFAGQWLVVKAIPDLLFDVDPSDRYSEALKLLGVNTPAVLFNPGITCA